MLFFTPNIDTKKEIHNFIPVHENDIYIYKNFFDKDIIEQFESKLKLLENFIPDNHWNYEPGDEENQWINRSIDIPNIEIVDHNQSLRKELIMERFFTHRVTNFFVPEQAPINMFPTMIRINAGESFTTHHCEHGAMIADHQFYNSEWKLGLYFGQFEGGELYFPTIDFTLPVESNMMAVWKFDLPYEIKKTISGTRWSISDMLTHPVGKILV